MAAMREPILIAVFAMFQKRRRHRPLIAYQNPFILRAIRMRQRTLTT